MRRRSRVVGALGAALAVGAVGVGAALASFSATATNPANTFSAVPDFVAPSSSASVIMRSGGSVPGYVRQGGAYFVYANVTDTGNPASGVSTATANVSAITSGQTANALATTGGPWTVSGTSYNYRSSASITAGNPLAAGSKSYTLALADNAANSRTVSGYSVVVDNTVPTASDILTANGAGGTGGKPEAGDTVKYTFSEGVDPAAVLAGWDGTSTTVTAQIANSGNNDTFSVSGVNLGTVALGGNFVTGTRTFASSTMVMSGMTLTVTLGTASGAVNTVSGTSTAAWTPSASVTDYAGNAMSTTARSDTSGAHKQF